MWETFSEPHFWAAIELWTAARTNPELQRALAAARSPHRPAPVAVEGPGPHVAGVASGTVTNGIDPAATPSGTGCVDCDDAGGWWVHLRRCAQCGHVGCCDSSPAQHATAHAAHPATPWCRASSPARTGSGTTARDGAHRARAGRADPPPARPAGARAGRAGPRRLAAAHPLTPPPAARPQRGSSGACTCPHSSSARRRGSRASPSPPRCSPTNGCRTPPARGSGSSARTCRSAAPTSCAAPTTCWPSSTRPSGRRARSAPARATTARAWPTRAGASACAAGCTCPAPRRGRNASGSARSAASAVELVVEGDTLRRGGRGRGRGTPRAPAPRWCPRSTTCAPSPARARSAVEIVDQLGRAPDVVVVPVGGGGLLAGVGHLAGTRSTPASGSSAWSRRAPRAWRRRVAAGEPVALHRAGHVRRRRRGAPGRRHDLPAGARRGAELRHGGRGPGVHRDARPLPGRRHHRRARGRAGHRRARRRCGVGPGDRRRLPALGRQQRREPLRRGRRTLAGAPRAEALLPGRVPAGAGRAAPVPRRGARPGRRHRAVRVRQARQPRDRRRAVRHRARPAATATSRCGSGWRRARCASSRRARAARPTDSWS